MNKIWIIIQREFLVRVKKKSFIILTILMPFLMVGIVALPVWLSTLKSGEVTNVSVVDLTGAYESFFSENEEDITFRIVQPSGEMQEQVRQLLDQGSNVVMYCQGGVTDGNVTLYSDSEVPKSVERCISRRLTNELRKAHLAEYNVSDVDRVTQIVNEEYNVRTVRLDKEGGETESSSDIASFIGLMLALLIYMFILSYGGMVMQGVSEEKTNRIMEIMVSSVKPFQLMMGKIIGVALVGLFQCLIWVVLVSVLFTAAGTLFGISSMASPEAMTVGMNLPSEAVAASNAPVAEIMNILHGMNLLQMVLLFILYFIGGYLLFASIFAAIGASINEQADSQQFMMPIIILFIFALYAGMFSIENPDGPLAFWCSLIPLTSPVVMMVRLPFDVPMWQIVLSLALLYGTALLIVWLSAKIYRVGILMYGKKPSFKEMMKWIKYN
jgi:ABC-2 type transport system permease protein